MLSLTVLWYLTMALAALAGVASFFTRYVDGRTGQLYRRTGDVVCGVILIVCALAGALIVAQVGGFQR